MQITIFGSGYVGLVTGACLADAGNDVVCVDIDAAKIARLNAGQETPAPKAATRASGTFIATLSGRTLTWRLTFARLSGRVLAAHIHEAHGVIVPRRP